MRIRWFQFKQGALDPKNVCCIEDRGPPKSKAAGTGK
jgi:hypothetical protein